MDFWGGIGGDDEREDLAFDLFLLGVGHRDCPLVSEVILEVYGCGHAGILVKVRLIHDAEDGKAVVRLNRGLEELGLGLMARLRDRRKGVEEAEGEGLQGFWVPVLHWQRVRKYEKIERERESEDGNARESVYIGFGVCVCAYDIHNYFFC